MKKIKYLLLAIPVIFLTGCSKTCTQPIDNKGTYSIQDVGLKTELKTTTTSYHDIHLFVSGNFEANIDSGILNNLTKYTFDAVVGVEREYYYRTFTGIKLKDLLDFNRVIYGDSTVFTFTGAYNKKIKYTGKELNDNCYLIYQINGNDIYVNVNTNDNNTLTLMDVNKDATDWIYGLKDINIK